MNKVARVNQALYNSKGKTVYVFFTHVAQPGYRRVYSSRGNRFLWEYDWYSRDEDGMLIEELFEQNRDLKFLGVTTDYSEFDIEQKEVNA